MTEYKLDIFEVLKRLDMRDREYYDSLSPDEQKSLQPLILQRWLSGTSRAEQLELLDFVSNRYIFSLSQHKKLLWYLLIIGRTGKPQRYQWLKQTTRKSKSKKPHCIEMIKQYFNYSSKQALGVIETLSNEDIIEMAEEIGLQNDEINMIKKELDMPVKRKTKGK